jgi:tetratricopeptide (TPR) repeat protein
MLLALASGCARRPPAPPPPIAADLASAEQDTSAGCYLCLRDALAAYDRVLARAPGHPLATERAWLVTLALVARSRELGVPDATYVARAEQTAPLVRPVLRPLLDLVKSLPAGQPGAGIPDVVDFRTLRDTQPKTWAEWQAASAPPATTADDPLVRALVLRVQCAWPEFTGTSREALQAAPEIDTPLILAWSRATCLANNLEAIAHIVAAEPRFAEAHYFLGLQMLLEGRLDAAADEIRLAHAAFAPWPRAAISLGNVEVGREAFDAAVALYDEALVAQPDNRQALIGKVKALSYAGRHDEAIAVADRMIALGTWMMGDARYWRAWNLAELQRNDEAADEVALAKTLVANSEVLKLSGIIAYRRGQHEFARAELTASLALQREDCETPGYLGLVEAAVRQWDAAGRRFAEAASCNAQREATLAREDQARPDDSERVRKRRARDIAAAHRLQGWSFYQVAGPIRHAATPRLRSTIRRWPPRPKP